MPRLVVTLDSSMPGQTASPSPIPSPMPQLGRDLEYLDRDTLNQTSISISIFIYLRSAYRSPADSLYWSESWNEPDGQPPLLDCSTCDIHAPHCKQGLEHLHPTTVTVLEAKSDLAYHCYSIIQSRSDATFSTSDLQLYRTTAYPPCASRKVPKLAPGRWKCPGVLQTRSRLVWLPRSASTQN